MAASYFIFPSIQGDAKGGRGIMELTFKNIEVAYLVNFHPAATIGVAEGGFIKEIYSLKYFTHGELVKYINETSVGRLNNGYESISYTPTQLYDATIKSNNTNLIRIEVNFKSKMYQLILIASINE